jgi:hypothetical protein
LLEGGHFGLSAQRGAGAPGGRAVGREAFGVQPLSSLGGCTLPGALLLARIERAFAPCANSVSVPISGRRSPSVPTVGCTASQDVALEPIIIVVVETAW